MSAPRPGGAPRPAEGPADDRLTLTVDQVRHLVAAQFPQWAQLPVRSVAAAGWDNHTFRLGSELSVRLPSHARYAAGVAKEQRWLPWLAPRLPLPIPVPVAAGEPTAAYPLPWSVYRWIEGDPARVVPPDDLVRCAEDLADFLNVLHTLDGRGGPAAGAHSFFRGGNLATYDEETRRCLARLDGRIDVAAATAVWGEALAAGWRQSPVWFHGDVAAGNLLIRDGRLYAVIDFGTCGVGDPSCDLVIAWTLLDATARLRFREVIQASEATWARARGWALWKALIGLAGLDLNAADQARLTTEIGALLADARGSS